MKEGMEDGMEIEIVEGKEKELQPVEKSYDAGSIVRLAVENNLDVEKLERLIDMKNREEARIAKLDFDAHFTAMQKEYPTVRKSKEVRNRAGDKVLYTFCPLEEILKVFSPILGKYGFSYRWSEEHISDTIKRVWCIISGYGHEEKGYVDIPIQPGNEFTNAIQQRGVSSTYGKRYSFINATGIIIEGEDNDGQMDDEQVMVYAEYIKRIHTAPTIEELQKRFLAVTRELTGDRRGREMVIMAKDKRKKELTQ